MRFTRYLVLIGIALFLFILYSVGPLQVLQNLAKFDPFIFSFALLLFPPIILLKGWKQQVLLSALDARISLFESSKIWLVGFFYGMVTPAKAGDFFRVIYLKKAANLPFGKGLAATAFERILDLAYLFVTGLLGLILFSLHFSLDFSIVLLLAVFLALFIAAVFVLTRKRWVSFLLTPLFKFFLPERFKEKLANSFNDFFEGVHLLLAAKKTLFFVGLLTVVSWFSMFLQFYLAVLALGLSLSLEFFFWVMPAILLIEVLPISFSGVGTRDATAIFFFSFVGITAGQAVSFSLSILFLTILTGLLGLIFLNGREFRALAKGSENL